jgi:hypothetical protein
MQKKQSYFLGIFGDFLFPNVSIYWKQKKSPKLVCKEFKKNYRNNVKIIFLAVT